VDEFTIISPRSRDRQWTIGEILEKGDILTGISSKTIERFECYAIALQHGFLTIGEVRRLEGLPPKEEV